MRKQGDLFKRRYDVVCSLGSDCLPATYLKAYCLRNASYPFDWTIQPAFDVKARLIIADFAGYLEPANVHAYPERPSNTNHVSHIDEGTGTIFLHDFDPGVDADEMLATVRARYDRRIKRLLKAIASGKRVLFVNFEREQNATPNDKFLVFLDAVAKKYPGSRVSLLALKNRPGTYAEEQVSETLMVVHAGIYPPGVDFPGDRKTCRRIFSRIRAGGELRRFCLRMRARRFVCRLLSHFAFGQEARRKFRDDLQKRLGVPPAL